MANDFDLYEFTKINGVSYTPPFVKINERNSDKYEKYFTGISRLDKLSFKYYGNATYGKIILIANPQFLSESEIDDQAVIRIPFPLTPVLTEIQDKIRNKLDN